MDAKADSGPDTPRHATFKAQWNVLSPFRIFANPAPKRPAWDRQPRPTNANSKARTIWKRHELREPPLVPPEAQTAAASEVAKSEESWQPQTPVRVVKKLRTRKGDTGYTPLARRAMSEATRADRRGSLLPHKLPTTQTATAPNEDPDEGVAQTADNQETDRSHGVAPVETADTLETAEHQDSHHFSPPASEEQASWTTWVASLIQPGRGTKRRYTALPDSVWEKHGAYPRRRSTPVRRNQNVLNGSSPSAPVRSSPVLVPSPSPLAVAKATSVPPKRAKGWVYLDDDGNPLSASNTDTDDHPRPIAPPQQADPSLVVLVPSPSVPHQGRTRQNRPRSRGRPAKRRLTDVQRETAVAAHDARRKSVALENLMVKPSQTHPSTQDTVVSSSVPALDEISVEPPTAPPTSTFVSALVPGVESSKRRKGRRRTLVAPGNVNSSSKKAGRRASTALESLSKIDDLTPLETMTPEEPTTSVTADIDHTHEALRQATRPNPTSTPRTTRSSRRRTAGPISQPAVLRSARKRRASVAPVPVSELLAPPGLNDVAVINDDVDLTPVARHDSFEAAQENEDKTPTETGFDTSFCSPVGDVVSTTEPEVIASGQLDDAPAKNPAPEAVATALDNQESPTTSTVRHASDDAVSLEAGVTTGSEFDGVTDAGTTADEICTSDESQILDEMLSDALQDASQEEMHDASSADDDLLAVTETHDPPVMIDNLLFREEMDVANVAVNGVLAEDETHEAPVMDDDLLCEEAMHDAEIADDGVLAADETHPALMMEDLLFQEEIYHANTADGGVIAEEKTHDAPTRDDDLLSQEDNEMQDAVTLAHEVTPGEDMHHSRTADDDELLESCSSPPSSFSPGDVARSPSPTSILLEETQTIKIQLNDQDEDMLLVPEQFSTEAAVPPDETTTIALNDEDEDVLKAFLDRSRASKARKIAERAHLASRRDSDIIQAALASPRRPLENLDSNSPSPRKPKSILSKGKLSPIPMLDDVFGPEAAGDVVAAAENNPGEEDELASADPTFKPVLDDGSEITTQAHSRRSLRAPSRNDRGPSAIALRRTGNEAECVNLKKSEAQQMALLTRSNTRRNKGGSVHARVMLARLQGVAVEPFEDPSPTASPDLLGRVRWNEQLVAFYDESKKDAAGMIVEGDAAPKEEEMVNPRPRAKRSRMLGAANGTPAKPRLKDIDRTLIDHVMTAPTPAPVAATDKTVNPTPAADMPKAATPAAEQSSNPASSTVAAKTPTTLLPKPTKKTVRAIPTPARLKKPATTAAAPPATAIALLDTAAANLGRPAPLPATKMGTRGKENLAQSSVASGSARSVLPRRGIAGVRR